MVKKLVSKAELSRIAGVSAAIVTRRVKDTLKPAVEGKKINLNHKVVKEWLESKKEHGPATGIDPLYQIAIDLCKSKNEFTPNILRNGLKIGASRSNKIFKMIQAAGIFKTETIQPPAPPPPPDITPGIQHPTKTKKYHALKKLNESDQIIHDIPDDIRAFIDMTLKELIQRFGTDVAFLDWLKATKSIEDINEKRLKNAVTQGELVSRDLIKIGVIDPINAAHIKLLTDGAKTIARRVTAMHGAGRSLEDCEKFVADQMTSFIRPIKSKVARALKNA